MSLQIKIHDSQTLLNNPETHSYYHCNLDIENGSAWNRMLLGWNETIMIHKLWLLL